MIIENVRIVLVIAVIFGGVLLSLDLPTSEDSQSVLAEKKIIRIGIVFAAVKIGEQRRIFVTTEIGGDPFVIVRNWRVRAAIMKIVSLEVWRTQFLAASFACCCFLCIDAEKRAVER